MTVIEFGKKDLKTNFAISLLMMVLVIASVWGILIYNRLIGLRHDIASAKETLENYQVKNAELKNQLYQILDGVNEEALLASSGLVADKSPQYLKNSHQLVSGTATQ
ncbi:MAG: hypothetical protein UV58_C0004G0067 [Candidatus Wolfebacteria bacterium GW2011_GWC1_43_10]|uniref:Cell division protein FtsL n=1 Tax=Candidatus Wolfebacteria bacterium GW2011_GWC1_43_10 TaxID=1619011 RepID=A0A0G1CBU6_9BACT|nr:MAG: hypothetical protein UV58_C0004G0067 [Candidatus Wolfebacteria bacterium GW2011_GWC1_43_10]